MSSDNAEVNKVHFSNKLKPEDKKQPADSTTNVHFSENGVNKYMSGRRLPISIRIDSGLYSAFKRESKRVYGSTCKAVEVYMIAFIEAIEKGVHFCPTQQVKIGTIVVHRNVSRERRDLKVESETLKCGYRGCGEVAIGKGVWLESEKEYALCKAHLSGAKKNPKQWKVISESETCPVTLKEAAVP